ncbi:hypothetical protein U1S09_001939, partial [Campylobacter coli]|nr:hypothetical protein [Campylobacter coli]
LEIITLGSIIAFANICYLINKDCIKYCEDEIKEISKLIKEAFEKTIEYKETKEDERNRLRLTAIISHIEALQYTRLIKENDLQKTIRIFATSINDYFDGGINDEDFIGFYKNTLKETYNMKASFKKYIKHIFIKKMHL